MNRKEWNLIKVYVDAKIEDLKEQADGFDHETQLFGSAKISDSLNDIEEYLIRKEQEAE